MKNQALIAFPANGDSFAVTVVKSQSSPRRKKILVAEDNDLTRELILCALTNSGFDAIGACDGEMAWETLTEREFDLLITDNEMPRLKGTELVERIRGAGMTIPVIVASGTFSADEQLDPHRLAIAAFLQKPFHMATFLGIVEEVLQGERSGLQPLLILS